MKSGLKTSDLPQSQWQKVEEKGPLGLCCQRDHLPTRRWIRPVVDILEIGRLPTQTRAVIDDLAVNLFGAVVDE